MITQLAREAKEMAGTKISIKLKIDKETHKVIVAEAEKDFIDFLFHNLSLPVGTLLSLFPKESMLGGLGALYRRVENLPDKYLRPDVTRNSLLQPKVMNMLSRATDFPAPLLLPGEDWISEKFYSCYFNGSHKYVADIYGLVCPECRSSNSLSREMKYVVPKVEGEEAVASRDGVYVKGMVTYIVMDNLEVHPFSSMAFIHLMRKFPVIDISRLLEKVVEVGVDEGIALLKSALRSESILTDVFLGKKGNDLKCEDAIAKRTCKR